VTITVLYIIASIFAISVISVIGIFFLFMRENTLREFTFLLLGLSVGTMLGGAFFHLIPDVFSKSDNVSVSFAILSGIFTFFLLEKLLTWQHSHTIHSNHAEPCTDCLRKDKTRSHIGHMVLISDGLHNVLDGILIAVSFFVSPVAGLATTVAVLLHEIPQEIGDFGVLLHSGFSKLKALLYNFISATSAFAGAGLVIAFDTFVKDNINIFTAFAAGSLLYIAMSDLVPELHRQNKRLHIILQILTVTLGAMLMYALTFLDILLS